MGAWGHGIMQGDTPMDIKWCFEERFGETKPADPEQAAHLIDDITKKELRGDRPVTAQVVGWLQIQRGGKFNDTLRRYVLEGIDDDDVDGAGWSDPAERRAKLAEFRAIVVAYPDAGAKVELPDNIGLFDILYEKIQDGTFTTPALERKKNGH